MKKWLTTNVHLRSDLDGYDALRLEALLLSPETWEVVWVSMGLA